MYNLSVKRKIKFRGKIYPTLVALLNTNLNPDLSHKTFCKRLNEYKWPVEKALLTKIKNPLIGRKLKIDGKKFDSLASAERKTGIKRATIAHRLKSNWPRNKVLEKNPNVDNLKPISIGSRRFRSCGAAAKAFGINNYTFLKRLRSGWTPEQAAELKEPPYNQHIPRPITRKDYIFRLKDIHGDNLSFRKSKFKRARDKIEVICTKGKRHENFWATPNNLLKGKGCNICQISHGGKIIARWLEKNKINYLTEWTDHNLYSLSYFRAKLRFDFYIKKLNLIIEYDGEQHYRPMTLGRMTKKNALKQFKIIKRNDKLKNNWAKKNKIRMIRIRYDQNILKILENKIRSL